MEGKWFTVEQAASIMGCTPRNIRHLVAQGWLQGQAGTPNRAGSARVSEKSLFQVMILDGVSHIPTRVLRDLKNSRKYFENNSGKTANPNRYIIRGEDEANPSPNPFLQGEGKHKSDPQNRYLHYDFAVKNQRFFRRRARQLAPGDPSFQDDLVQQMSLAVLECNHPANDDFLFERANSRAKDYIRYEASRGKLSLDEAQYVSDKRAEQRAGLEAYISELLQRGVPQYWIDEVIGYRLEVA